MVNWTGVLEKRDGRWGTVQRHFSFAAKDLLGGLAFSAECAKLLR
jgi:hypothetical protein